MYTRDYGCLEDVDIMVPSGWVVVVVVVVVDWHNIQIIIYLFKYIMNIYMGREIVYQCRYAQWSPPPPAPIIIYIVQQTQWDKGSIFRDTSTGGTTFSNLYQINQWSI